MPLVAPPTRAQMLTLRQIRDIIVNAWTNHILTNQNNIVKIENGEVKTAELFMLPISQMMRTAELLRLYGVWSKTDRENFGDGNNDGIGIDGCRRFI